MAKLFVSLLFISILLISPASAAFGVDVSDLISTESFQCLVDAFDISFSISRGYCSIGEVDFDAIQTNANAQSLGISTDVYLFPCAAVDPQETTDDFVASMVNSDGDDIYSIIWLDVEYNPSTRCAWTSDFDWNCQYLSQLANALLNAGKQVGIYSSQYQWENIFGSSDSCPYFVDLPVWYAHYDKNPSFDDWYNGYSFGGWTTPLIKQYDGTTDVCDIGADLNFY